MFLNLYSIFLIRRFSHFGATKKKSKECKYSVETIQLTMKRRMHLLKSPTVNIIQTYLQFVFIFSFDS